MRRNFGYMGWERCFLFRWRALYVAFLTTELFEVRSGQSSSERRRRSLFYAEQQV